MIDNGSITTAEAIDILSVKSSLKKPEIAQIFDLRTDIMFPLEKMPVFFLFLKNKNFGLYFHQTFPGYFWEIKSSFNFSHISMEE